jgi:hypothetical protein
VAPAADAGLTLEQTLTRLELAQRTASETRAALETELAKWGLNA